MKTITLTAPDASKFSGQIPEGWHEVLLSDWLHFEKQKEGKPEGLGLALLVASLTRLPVDKLAEDVSLVPLLIDQMPWLQAMPAPEPMLTFQHQGTTYEHVGNLEKVSMAQFEALLTYLEQAEGNSMQATPELLAVLYKLKGTVQDSDNVKATAEAFRSLPMDKTWGAIAFFLTSSEPLATRTHAYSQSRSRLLQTVTMTEQALAASPSRKRSLRTAAWLGRTYIRSVRKLL